MMRGFLILSRAGYSGALAAHHAQWDARGSLGEPFTRGARLCETAHSWRMLWA